MDEGLFHELVSFLNEDHYDINTISKRLIEVDKEDGDLVSGEVLCTLNLSGCLTMKQIYKSCFILAVTYFNGDYNPFWFHILCILDCVFRKEPNPVWTVLNDPRSVTNIKSKRIDDIDDYDVSIDYVSLRSRLLLILKENYVSGMAYTGIPHKPSFLPNSNSCLYSQYKSYQFSCLGIKAFKRPSLDFTVSPKDITPLHLPVSPSFLFDVYCQPLDTRSCIISLLHKALDEPLDSVSSQYIENHRDIFVSLLQQHQSGEVDYINEQNILFLSDQNPILGFEFLHYLLKNSHLHSKLIRILITMRLSSQRMTVLLKLLGLNDIDSISMQSSILSRLLMHHDEKERNHMIEMYIKYLEDQGVKDISYELESFCIEFLDIPIVNQFFERVKGDS